MTYDYSEHQDRGPGDNILAEITHLANEQLKAEAAVAAAEEALKKAQAELRDIAEHKLPDLMDKAQQKSVTTLDGVEVQVAEAIRASIPKDGADKALKWLEEHKHGNLIKRQFVIEFGKDEEAWAKKFKADMDKRKRQLNAKIKRTVHAQTLAAFIKEQLEEGVELDLALFGAFRQRFTKLKVKTA